MAHGLVVDLGELVVVRIIGAGRLSDRQATSEATTAVAPPSTRAARAPTVCSNYPTIGSPTGVLPRNATE